MDIFGSPLAVRNEEKKGGDKITCIADDAGPSHRFSMRQGGTGASGGQIAISKDDFALHAKTICERIESGRYKRRYILKRKAT